MGLEHVVLNVLTRQEPKVYGYSVTVRDNLLIFHSMYGMILHSLWMVRKLHHLVDGCKYCNTHWVGCIVTLVVGWSEV